MKKRVLFVHYRTGEKDGVGLEIEKRARLLKELGCEVFYLTGFDVLSRDNAFVIREIDMRAVFNRFIREDCFYKKMCEESISVALYHQMESKIYKKIKKVFKEISPCLVFVHNLFSHAYNLPATTALLKLLDRYEPPTVVINHDFWFERAQFLKPKHIYIQEILKSLPPNRSYIIKHQVINSIAQRELLKRRKIKAERIGDFFDYYKPLVKIDDFNSDFKEYFGIKEEDFVILHATRITTRKAIENTLLFAVELKKALKKLAPIKVNGKIFQKSSRVIVFFPNFVEVDALEYFKSLKVLAEKLEVKVVWAWEKFQMERQTINGIKKYSFWDAYVFADLAAYTSLWEGFGNQFLEAVYFRKLLVIFEYPVFEKDIKKEGYFYVSLGNKVIKRNGFCFVKKDKIIQVVENTVNLIRDNKKLKQIVDKNFETAKRNHDERILKKDLKALLSLV